MEYLTAIVMGFLMGFLIGLWLENKFNKMRLDYKADTGIDMCIGGKFYTIRRNYEREENEK